MNLLLFSRCLVVACTSASSLGSHNVRHFSKAPASGSKLDHANGDQLIMAGGSPPSRPIDGSSEASHASGFKSHRLPVAATGGCFLLCLRGADCVVSETDAFVLAGVYVGLGTCCGLRPCQSGWYASRTDRAGFSHLGGSSAGQTPGSVPRENLIGGSLIPSAPRRRSRSRAF